MKTAIMACLVAACTMCGHALAGTAERRKRLLGGLIGGLRLLRIEFFSSNPLESALRHTNLALFESVADTLPGKRSPSEAWLAVRSGECSRGKGADALSESDLALLDRLFDHLGASGREEQIEAMQSCISALEEALIEAQERASQVGRLYTSLGFLAGLALAILLI